MGQRLVLNVYKNEKSIENESSLCSIYYHWSGYTYNSIVDTLKFYKSYSKYIKEYEEDEIAIVLSLLDNTNTFRKGMHGGVVNIDREYFKNKYNDKYPDIVDRATSKTVSRDLGLVGFTEDIKDEINNVSEAIIDLCLDQDSENPRPWINIEGTCYMINNEDDDIDEYIYELEFDNIQKVYLDTICDDEIMYKLLYGAKITITSKYHGTVYGNIY